MTMWTFGLTSSGGVHTLTRVSRQRPKLTQMLCRLIKQQTPANFKFTSMCLCQDIRLRLHRDLKNLGLSAICGLTLHTGGELWVQTPESEATSWKTIEGDTVPGKLLPTRQQTHLFDARLWHSAEETVQRPRWVLAAYTTATARHMPDEIRASLLSLDFPVEARGRFQISTNKFFFLVPYKQHVAYIAAADDIPSYIYIYIYTYIHTHTYMYTYTDSTRASLSNADAAFVRAEDHGDWRITPCGCSRGLLIQSK